MIQGSAMKCHYASDKNLKSIRVHLAAGSKVVKIFTHLRVIMHNVNICGQAEALAVERVKRVPARLCFHCSRDYTCVRLASKVRARLLPTEPDGAPPLVPDIRA